jgi:hypothetical protein
MISGKKKKSKAAGGTGAPAQAMALQAGSFAYHPEEDFIDKVSVMLRSMSSTCYV